MNPNAFSQPTLYVPPFVGAAALDAPASIEHTGRVLNEVVGADATTRAGEAIGTARTEDAGPTVSTDEAEEMEEHLRGLGYLE